MRFSQEFIVRIIANHIEKDVFPFVIDTPGVVNLRGKFEIVDNLIELRLCPISLFTDYRYLWE